VSHLRKTGFDLAAGIVSGLSGDTYVKEQVNVGNRVLHIFWAIFEFLKGEDRYSWMDTHLSAEDLESAAKVLARLHLAGLNFVAPPGTDRVLTTIMDLLPTFHQTYPEYCRNAGTTRFDQCFLENCDAILGSVDRAAIPASDLKKLPFLPIHGDYHQGNLKYEASRVIGVFDFDWSKIDLRLFDLAQAMVYFCTSWNGDQDGILDLVNAKTFLTLYNAGCESAADLGPLNAMEQAYLPLMLKAANLFILHLVIVYFYMTDDPDSEAYLDVFNHVLKSIEWIETHADRIAAIC
jgi:homoserine kinase type II